MSRRYATRPDDAAIETDTLTLNVAAAPDES
jgi:hypothetical protein